MKTAIRTAAVGLVLAAAIGGQASAGGSTDAVRHKGKFAATPRSQINFKVILENGVPVQVKGLDFTKVTVYCDGQRDGWVNGFFTRTFQLRGTHFLKDKPYGGANFTHSRIRIEGDVLGGGERAAGSLRWKFVDGGGSSCTTKSQHWKTQAVG